MQEGAGSSWGVARSPAGNLMQEGDQPLYRFRYDFTTQPAGNLMQEGAGSIIYLCPTGNLHMRIKCGKL